MEKTILLTGATGFLGSHLIPELTKNNFRIICLIRPQKGVAPAERIRTTLQYVGSGIEEILSCLDIREGDLGQKNFGLDEQAYQQLKSDVDCILHCAAMTTFSADLAAEQWSINVEGTENLVRFALESKAIHDFHYISTAYVAGDRTDLVYEHELDKGQGFFNGYEKSKFFAEKLLQQYAREAGLSLTVYRPSIIVGDSQSGRTVLFNGMYLFMRFFQVAKNSVQTTPEQEKVVIPVRCVGNPQVPKNFVHIDYVVNTIIALFMLPRAHGKTYHITHDNPPPLGLMREIIEEVLGISGIELVDASVFLTKPANDLELFLQEQVKVYSSYLLSEPLFDRSTVKNVLPPSQLPFCPPMDRQALHRLFTYAIESNWGRSIRGKQNSTRQ
ncbi:MAG: SDR family oxidoreductase [Pseudomonadota bacterium]